MVRSIFLLFLILQASVTSAQTPAAIHYDYTNGLPSNEVYDIYQDSAGFLWFATDNGLARFDGDEMKLFGSAEGLTDPVVFGIHPDGKGRLWFRTYSGNLSWISGNRIQPYPFNAVLAGISRNSLFQGIALGPDGTLHFAAGYYMGSVDSVGQLQLDSIKMPGLTCRLVNHQALLAYFGRTGRIRSISIDGTAYPIQLPDTLLRNHVVTSVEWMHRRWFSVGNAIFGYDGKTIIHTFTGPASIYSLSVDRQDRLWVGYDKYGADCFDSPEFVAGARILEKPVSVTRVLQDHEGGLWFSTLEQGVFYIPYPGIRHIPLTSGRVRLALAWKDQLLLGDQGGRLYRMRMSGETAEVRHLAYGILAGFVDSEGKIWLSTVSDTHILGSDLQERRVIPRLSQVSFSETAGRKIWGTGGSNTCFDIQGNVLSHYYRSNSRSILATDSIIYVGGRVGLSLYDTKFQLIAEPPDVAQYKIVRILRLRDKSMLLATQGGGLVLFELDSRRAIPCGELPFGLRNVINFLVDEDDLIVSTDQGIFSASLESVVKGTPAYKSVLGHSSLTTRVEHLIRVGNALCAVDPSAVTIIPKHSMARLNASPQFYMKGITINETVVDGNDLTLPAGQHRVKVSYGFLSFNNRNLFVRFRLSDNQPWQNGSIREIELLSPGSGKYHITVEYSIDGDAWVRPWDGFMFQVLPPWWRSGYFFVFIALLSGGLVAWMALVRIRRLRARQQLLGAEYELQQRRLNFELDAIEKERSRIAVELHDGVTSHLQAMRMASKRNPDYQGQIDHHIEHVLQEIRTIMNDLAPPSLQHFGLLAALRTYADRLNGLLPGTISFFASGEEVANKRVSVYAFRIIQELVTNALKHTTGGTVTIYLSAFPDNINILFEDHGGGIPLEEKRKGLGLLSIEARITALRGTYRVESTSLGTTFSIDLPQ